jgi:hypothetical protein
VEGAGQPGDGTGSASSKQSRPIRLLVRDDLERTRVTVFFRLLLAIPALVWVLLRGIAAFVVAFALWLAVLIEAKAPESLHDFVASYLRYSTQVGAYLLLAADPYPWFRVQPRYPVDLEIDGPVRQSRWSGGFRLVLALPAAVLASALGGGFSTSSPSASWSSRGGGTESYSVWVASYGGAAAAAAFLAWFAILARRRSPRGLRDLVAYALEYAAQASGYLLLVTPRYPTSDPAIAERYAVLPDHSVRIRVDDDLARPRLTVLFRLFLALPHFVWLGLWTIAVLVAAIVAWFVALATGRVPDPLLRFFAGFIRYATHVFAFVGLVGRRFPGFTGRAGSYGIDAEVTTTDRQSRWSVLFRLFLAIPALILNTALGGVLVVAAVLAWWYALVTGRMPEGLRNLGASCLRYSAQTDAYLLLCTERYPYAAPVLRGGPPHGPEPLPPWVPRDAF